MLTPVRMDDEGVVDVQLLSLELVLLRPLVLDVVTKTPGEPDLGRVVNIAPNLQLYGGLKKGIYIFVISNRLHYALCFANQNANKNYQIFLFSFIHGPKLI